MNETTLLRIAIRVTIALLVGAMLCGTVAEAAPGSPPLADTTRQDLRPLAMPGRSQICTGNSIDSTSTSASFEQVVACSLTLQAKSVLIITASSSVSLAQGSEGYEAAFRVAVDATSLPQTERRVGISTNPSYGIDGSMTTIAVLTVGPGDHLFALMAARSGGNGTMQLYNPTITVLVLPSVADIQICQSDPLAASTTTTSTFAPVATCSLTTTESGSVMLLANSTVGAQAGSGLTTGRFRVGVDGVTVAQSERLTEIPADGSERSMALQHVQGVPAGTHSLTLHAARDGSGTLRLRYPTVVAVFVPDTSQIGSMCGSSGTTTVTVNSASLVPVVACRVTLKYPGKILVSTGSAFGLPKATEQYGAFICVDVNGTALGQTGMLLHLSTSKNNEIDRTLTTQTVQTLPPGTYTVTLMANRYDGSGAMQLVNPSVTVLAINDLPATFLPLMQQ